MTTTELVGLVCLLIIALGAVRLIRLTFGQHEPQLRSRLAQSESVLQTLLVGSILALVVIGFVVRTFYIPSASMRPTLTEGDVLIANEFRYRLAPPQDGDVAIFRPPIDTTDDFIKRVMAAPGDQFQMIDGHVTRNGQVLNEPYAPDRARYSLEVKDYTIYVDGHPLSTEQANIPPRSAWEAPDRVPPGCYLMLGDNRNNSDDSHVWGFAQDRGHFWSGEEAEWPASFTGSAIAVFWPLGRIGAAPLSSPL
jgi:signal peptidase I